MANMRERLDGEKLLSRMVAGSAVQAIHTSLQIVSSQQEGPQREKGVAKFGVVENALGVFDLNLIPPNDPRTYSLTFEVEAAEGDQPRKL
jgi:hypothetical protein